MLKLYLKIARPDHWIKQLFIIPGAVFCLLLVSDIEREYVAVRVILSLLSTCFIASANYVINEWLDAEFDKYHPTKRNRPVVSENINGRYVVLEYCVFSAVGLLLSLEVSRYVFMMELWLLVMGIIYNVKPIRSKEIPYVDVLSESLNNAIRLLIGWFTITSEFYPPVSVVIGYWMSGAFLMGIKRYAEYRMIGDKETAGLYRKSFKYYTEKSLLISSVYYALMAIFFCGIFMIKYKIELIFAIPGFAGLFCYYLFLSYKQDSSVQKPEKLYKEKGLMVYIFLFLLLTVILLFVSIDGLHIFLDTDLVEIR